MANESSGAGGEAKVSRTPKRSLTQEVLVPLEAAVARSRPVEAEEMLRKIRAFRKQFSFSADPAEIDAYRKMGRKM